MAYCINGGGGGAAMMHLGFTVLGKGRWPYSSRNITTMIPLQNVIEKLIYENFSLFLFKILNLILWMA